MSEIDRKKLLELGQMLTTTGAEFRLAQVGLEKAVDTYGMASPQAVECSRLCSGLALRFTQLEEEFLACLQAL